MSATQDIATAFTALCRAGDHESAGRQFWADNVVSIEAGPEGMVSTGKTAVIAKGEWWYGAHDVHSVETEGPYVNGDQFILRFAMDITQKESGQRMQMVETALYTVKDGKVVEERFFY